MEGHDKQEGVCRNLKIACVISNRPMKLMPELVFLDAQRRILKNSQRLKLEKKN